MAIIKTQKAFCKDYNTLIQRENLQKNKQNSAKNAYFYRLACVNCENFYESIDKHIIMLYYFTNKTDISFSVITVNAQTGNDTQEEVD